MRTILFVHFRLHATSLIGLLTATASKSVTISLLP